MNAVTLLRRHPFLLLAGLLATGVAAWIGYFLATFDLNQYREQLAGELSNRLRMPVQLGDAHLELREAGIAFRFTELHVGSEQTPVELHAEKLWLQLAWHGLLLRKPILNEIALDAPQLRIAPATPGSPEAAPRTDRFSLDLLRNLQIRRVEIQRGTMNLGWRDSAGTLHALSLNNLAIEIGNLGLARTVVIDVTGRLDRHGDRARLAVRGSIDLPPSGTLRDAVWDLALETKSLDAALLAGLLNERTGIEAAGETDLTLFSKGSLGDVVTVQAELTGRQLRVKPGSAYRNARPLKSLHLAGTWQRSGDAQQFRQLSLQLDDLRLAGDITINSSIEGQQLNGTLRNGTSPADTLRRWLPDHWQEEELLSRLLPGGTLILSQAAFDAELPSAPDLLGRLSLGTLEGEARNLAWTFGKDKSAELTRGTLRLRDGQWHIKDGAGVVAGLAVSLAGAVTPQSDGTAQFTADLEVSGTAEQFTALGTGTLPANLSVAGDLAIKGRLTGTTEQYSFDAQADLSRMDLRYGEELHVPPTAAALLAANGRGSRSGLAIDQAHVTVPPLQGTFSGTVDWADRPQASMVARVELAELAAAYDLAPALRKLQLRGGAVLDLSASGPLDSLSPQISLEAHDVSIPTHGVVADISQLNGRLLLKGKRVSSDWLNARIGKSPFTVKALIADLDQPRLELAVQAPSVRADELIFHSDRHFLRDLDGRLIFDRNGLFFSPVKVRLDGGTRATVNGSVKNFAAPEVDLDITGEYAQVEEIIGLWTDETPATTAARKARIAADPSHKPLPPIRIRVDAKAGDLYSMKFTNAKAIIVPTSRHLLLHPLNFNVGEGYCSAQVLVDYSGNNPVLRVSGQAEDVDAYQVYNELLDRKSIMRGQLRGDFYLQGELGEKRFLPTSYGNISITVRDGVMRHSPVLSTIFSVLNVSQLFKFKLPDINLEGLPFTLLTTEMSIDKGLISTERMVIDSEAISMSYAGQYDLVKDRLDLLVVAKPLGTIDKVVTRLPIAGWILGGEERALITAQFRVTGSADKPKVDAIPISAISKGILGIFQRTLGLPLKLIEDPEILWGGDEGKD